MSIEIPDEVKWLLPIVVGESWPEGDEDAMRRMADAWRTAANDIENVKAAANRGAEQAKGAMEGRPPRRSPSCGRTLATATRPR